MLLVRRYFLGVPIKTIFFAKKINLFDAFSLKQFVHSFFIKKVWGFKYDVGYTLHSDLSLTEDVLLQQFSSTCRNEVRRSIKDGIVCSEQKNIDEYISFFNDFASQKAINGVDAKRVASYGKNFIVFKAELDGEVLAMHSLLVDYDSSIVLLLTSANARFEDSKKRTIIGRANRYLHYYEMLYFKEHGLKIYDWGGIAKEDDVVVNPGLKGVNDFKLSFGGTQIENIVYSSYLFLFAQKLGILLGKVKSNSELQKESKNEK